jgi:hypothetical protein
MRKVAHRGGNALGVCAAEKLSKKFFHKQVEIMLPGNILYCNRCEKGLSIPLFEIVA